MGSDSYDLADERYPLPTWAQHFVVRVDHSPARWKWPAAHGLTAAEALLLLLEGLGDRRGDGLTDGSGSQEAQDGCAGHATNDNDDGPDAGCATVCGQDGTPPWLSWPVLTLPV